MHPLVANHQLSIKINQILNNYFQQISSIVLKFLAQEKHAS